MSEALSVPVNNNKEQQFRPTRQLRPSGAQAMVVNLRSDAVAMRKRVEMMNNSARGQRSTLQLATSNENMPLAPRQVKPAPMAEVLQREKAGVASDMSGTYLTGYSDKAKQLNIKNTKVSYTTDTLASSKETVGVSMEASPVGPDHPQGDKPNQAVAKNHMNAFNQHDSYIRGHLLNGDIGGPGRAENLFPITAQANSQHYHQIEKHVVNWVNAEKKYVYYKVEVKNRDDKNGRADFECKAHQLDSGLNPTGIQIQATIHSEPKNSSANQNLVDTKGAGQAVVDTQLGDNDIELQVGKKKVPTDYMEIDDAILDLMESDFQLRGMYGSSVLEKKLGNLGFKENDIEEIVLFVESEDDAVWQNINKNKWNKMVEKINSSYV